MHRFYRVGFSFSIVDFVHRLPFGNNIAQNCVLLFRVQLCGLRPLTACAVGRNLTIAFIGSLFVEFHSTPRKGQRPLTLDP